MQRMLVDQTAIQQITLENVVSEPLEAGQVRLRLNSFALTANNVTYAATGFTVGYWKFFPSGIEGQGIVPVWGVAEVIESRNDRTEIGTLLYGFYPLAEELIIEPRTNEQGVITDGSLHRADLPGVYNRYIPVALRDDTRDHLRALLQPLLATSWLLFDWLIDNDCFGAEQIIIGSASSKTGLGLCKFLAEPDQRAYRIVGLTSAGNRAFVEGVGACDQVLTYDACHQVAQVPSVYVDMSGNGRVRLALHERLEENLKHSAAVGLSHWDKFTPKQELPGVRPQFFFAPAQIAKRRADWGPGAVENKIDAAWQRIAQSAQNWLDLRVHEGLGSAPAVYQSLASGQANPRDGHIITL